MKKLCCDSQSFFTLPKRPLLIIISGPSGAGKDAVLNRMKKFSYPLKYIVTTTTRPPRATEKNNIDYHFISKKKFQDMVENQEFLEWASVYDNWYGVPKEPLKQALNNKQDVILKVDIQGVTTIKEIIPQAIFIFITPPSIDELMLRLEQRNTESFFDMSLRTSKAEEELKKIPLFDYIIMNRQDQIDQAVSDIMAIISAEKSRVHPRDISL